MSIGDLLEWAAALALVAAAWLAFGLPAGLVATAVALGYFGQCYDDRPARVALPHRRPRKRAATSGGLWPSGPPSTVFHCAECDGETPAGQPHVCP